MKNSFKVTGVVIVLIVLFSYQPPMLGHSQPIIIQPVQDNLVKFDENLLHTLADFKVQTDSMIIESQLQIIRVKQQQVILTQLK